jgi:hypothetical protein
MIHAEGHPSLSANQNWRSVFGGGRSTTGGTPGVTANQSNSWLPRAVNVYRYNHIRGVATGVGNSFNLILYDGTTALATLAFDNADGTQDTLTSTVTLSAATSSAISEAHLFDHTQIGSTSALGTTTLVYQDASEEDVSYYCAGDGTSSIGSVDGTTGRFIAIGGTGTTGSSTEAPVQMPIVQACTMKYAAVRYTTGTAGTDYNLEIRRVATSGTGVVQDTIPLPAATTGALVIDSTLAVTFSVGDLLSFRLIRTAGTGTTIQCNLVFGLQAA